MLSFTPHCSIFISGLIGNIPAEYSTGSSSLKANQNQPSHGSYPELLPGNTCLWALLWSAGKSYANLNPPWWAISCEMSTEPASHLGSGSCRAHRTRFPWDPFSVLTQKLSSPHFPSFFISFWGRDTEIHQPDLAEIWGILDHGEPTLCRRRLDL